MEKRLRSTLSRVGTRQYFILANPTHMQGQKWPRPNIGLRHLVCHHRIPKPAPRRHLVKLPVRIGWLLDESGLNLRKRNRIVGKAKSNASTRRCSPSQQIKLPAPISIGLADLAQRQPRDGPTTQSFKVVRA